jgi:hypothetical protein
MSPGSSADNVATEQAIFSSKCHLPVILLMLSNITVGTASLASHSAEKQRLSLRCWGPFMSGLAPGIITMAAWMLDPGACAERNWVHRSPQ